MVVPSAKRRLQVTTCNERITRIWQVVITVYMFCLRKLTGQFSP
jgi:hypothetical protein